MTESTLPAGQMARMLDMTERRLQQLAAAGVIPRSEKGRYPVVRATVAYVRYLRERSLKGDIASGDGGLSAKERRALAEADMAEMEAARMRGELVSAVAVRTALASRDVAVKDRLLAVPMAAADRALDSARGRQALGIAEVYDAEIRAALAALAGAEVVTASTQ